MILRLAAFLVFFLFAGGAFAELDPSEIPMMQKFFGKYVGQAEETVGEARTKRDIDVAITPYKKGKGFSILWTTIIYQKDRTEKGVKRRSETANFLPSGRDGLFRVDGPYSVFSVSEEGGLEKGEPVLWASIQEKVLTVYSLVVDEKGTYFLQTYRRTLTDSGLAVHFETLSDGKIIRAVKGTLVRAKETEN